MKTITLDILNDKALNLLKDLELLKIIRLRKDKVISKTETKKNVSFTVLKSDSKNFKFNRDKATER